MKNSKWVFTAISFLWLALTLSGCKEYTTKTKINPDGSCERIVMVEGDTANIGSLPFPVPVDKSWQIEKKKSEKDSTKVVYLAKKGFDSAELLGKEYVDKNKINVRIKFEKKFRWFYTYYEYEETYKSFFPYKIIPLKSYLTEEEFKTFLNDDTTKAIKNRLDNFAAENFLEYFLMELVKECQAKGIKEVNEASVHANKKSIMEDIDKYDKDYEALLNSIAKRLGAPSLKSFKPFVEKLVIEVEKKMEWTGSANGTYTNQVSMPGIILTTNSKSVQGNVVEWKVSAERFMYEDFVMNVESRSANIASFIVTGIIIAFVVLLLIMPKLRRK